MRPIEHSRWMTAVGLLLAVAAGACGGSSSRCASGSDCAAADSFESDLPSATSNTNAGERGAPTLGATASAGASVPTGAPATNGAAISQDDASRVIAEADIIQVQGDQLYTLSRSAGLTVIDASHPEALSILGRYRELPADPFEMYLRGDTALVMFTGWGEYQKLDTGDYTWVSTSKVVALDVSDPSAITSLASFEVAGSISDSRIVGNIMYVIGHEDGYCWDCKQNDPRTTILSLDVSDPHAVQKVDELAYDDGNGGWGPRSVTVTDQRMYVAGPEYGSAMPTDSTIQVIDISDPAGHMVEGAAVRAAGQISSRWQMDETDGVLRVISQTPFTEINAKVTAPPPSVQTFKVVSSKQIDALGQTNLSLPANETLRSARFDGPRAYAITAEQRDPLFTIDLSDPAHPRQVGQLALPGYVYYMEPRGERVLGLGFDQGNPAGSITVSLFNVHDLAAPQLLSRVNFGGNWGSLPEDQDRIQKVFRVLDDAGMILVPFSGWSDASVDKNGCSIGSYSGGVQIIDFKNDTLTARAATPGSNEIRRALLQSDRLLTVSDDLVQSFDITDRDTPKLLSQVVLARYTQESLQLAGNTVARISQDVQTGQPLVDFVAAADAGEPNLSLGKLDLSGSMGDGSACSKSFSISDAFVHGAELDLLYDQYEYNANTSNSRRGLIVVDASDPTKPRLLSNTSWDNNENWSSYSGFYSYGPFISNQANVRTDHALALLESSWTYVNTVSSQHTQLRVIDLRDESAVNTSVLPLTANESYSGLIVGGDAVLTSHFIGNEAGDRGRFYVDRLDLSDPSAPKLAASINVPGALMQYDRSSGRALTTEQTRVRVPDVTPTDCYARFAYAEFAYPAADGGSVSSGIGVSIASPSAAGSNDGSADAGAPPPEPKGVCTGYQQKLHLVSLGPSTARLEDTLALNDDQQVTESSLGDGVIFATLGKDGGGYYGGGIAVPISDGAFCLGCGGVASQTTTPVQLLVLGGLAAGKFEVGQISVDTSSDPWWGFWGAPGVYAFGKQALLIGQSDAAIVDATNPSAPSLTRKLPLVAAPSYVDVRDRTALLTLGNQGVQWLSLD